MEKNQAQLSFKKLFYARKSFSRLILQDKSQLLPSAASFEKTKYNSNDIILDFFEYQNGNFLSKIYQPLVFLVFLVKKSMFLTRIAHTIVPP